MKWWICDRDIAKAGALRGKCTCVNKIIRKKVSAYKAGEGQNKRSKAKCRFSGMGTHSKCLDGKQAIVDDFMATLQ